MRMCFKESFKTQIKCSIESECYEANEIKNNGYDCTCWMTSSSIEILPKQALGLRVEAMLVIQVCACR